jgi:hypothetical protein
MRHLFVWVLCAVSGVAQATLDIKVVARVGGQVVTDRRVAIDHYLEQPEDYAPGVRRQKLSPKVFDQDLQRLLTQIMVTEENRILALIQVTDTEIESSLADIRKAMGTKWKPFLTEFELNEAALRPLLSDKILLRKTLASRAKAVSPGKKDDKGQEIPREELVRQSLEEWLKQLQARYRVQMYRDDSHERTR